MTCTQSSLQESHFDPRKEQLDSSFLSHNYPTCDHSSTLSQNRVTVVDDVLTQRFSCRYFLSDKVPSDETLHSILEVARHAPSGSNFQPWKVHVLKGQSKARVAQKVTLAHKTHADQYKAPYAFYPSNETLQRPEYGHLQKRREHFGKQFYGPLNIPRNDTEARKAVTQRNWSFFDAPIGFLITTIPDAPSGSYLDVGFFVMSLIVALRSHGLECCVQESHATFHDIYFKELSLAKTESVVCGIALGFPDMDKVRKLSGHQEKMSLEELVVYHD